MRRIVEKGVGQVKHVGDFAQMAYSSKSTNICNEYGRSNVFITDPRQTAYSKTLHQMGLIGQKYVLAQWVTAA